MADYCDCMNLTAVRSCFSAIFDAQDQKLWRRLLQAPFVFPISAYNVIVKVFTGMWRLTRYNISEFRNKIYIPFAPKVDSKSSLHFRHSSPLQNIFHDNEQRHNIDSTWDNFQKIVNDNELSFTLLQSLIKHISNREGDFKVIPSTFLKLELFDELLNFDRMDYVYTLDEFRSKLSERDNEYPSMLQLYMLTLLRFGQLRYYKLLNRRIKNVPYFSGAEETFDTLFIAEKNNFEDNAERRTLGETTIQDLKTPSSSDIDTENIPPSFEADDTVSYNYIHLFQIENKRKNLKSVLHTKLNKEYDLESYDRQHDQEWNVDNVLFPEYNVKELHNIVEKRGSRRKTRITSDSFQRALFSIGLNSAVSGQISNDYDGTSETVRLSGVHVTPEQVDTDDTEKFKEQSRSLLNHNVCPRPNEVIVCPATQNFNPRQNEITAYSASQNISQQRASSQLHAISPLDAMLKRLVSNTPPNKAEMMTLELLRLGSMCTLKNPVSSVRLAQAGFYYPGSGDEVVCFACGAKKSGWLSDDNPINIHRQLSPSCPFFTNSSLNIPANEQRMNSNVIDGPRHLSERDRDSGIGTSSQNTNIVSQSGYASNIPNISASGDTGYETNSHSQNAGGSSDHNLVISDQERQQAVTKFPQFSTFEKRLATYEHWPSNLRQQPRDLSQCGFFYTGMVDGVRCFRCAVGLRNWDPEDNPWVEHARWSSKCSYILEIKGQEFVNMVLEAARLAEAEQEVQRERDTINTDSVSVPNATLPTRNSSSANQTDSVCGMSTSAAGSSTANSTSKTQSNPTKMKSTETDSEKTQTQLKEVESCQRSDATGRSSSVKSSSEGASKMDTSNTESRNKVPPNIDNADTESLKKQIKEMTDLTNCKICLDEKVSVVFLPCGHLVACGQCSPALRKCPICRQFIKGHVRTTIGN